MSVQALYCVNITNVYSLTDPCVLCYSRAARVYKRSHEFTC